MAKFFVFAKHTWPRSVTKAHLASQREFFFKTENSARPGGGVFQFDVKEHGDRELMVYAAYFKPPGNNCADVSHVRSLH